MAQIAFVSRMTVKQGHEAEYVRLCKALAAKVLANEPRDQTLYFSFFKLREPRRYAVIEVLTASRRRHGHVYGLPTNRYLDCKRHALVSNNHQKSPVLA